MSKELKITKNIMEQIKQGKIKMRPRGYYVLGSILTFLGLVFSVAVSTFLFSLLRFSMRTQYGKGIQYKIDTAISIFPWWLMILGIISLVLGIWLIKKYNFSYKIKPVILIIAFILLLFLSGWILDLTGVNDVLYKKGHMKNIFQKYPKHQNFLPFRQDASFR